MKQMLYVILILFSVVACGTGVGSNTPALGASAEIHCADVDSTGAAVCDSTLTAQYKPSPGDRVTLAASVLTSEYQAGTITSGELVDFVLVVNNTSLSSYDGIFFMTSEGMGMMYGPINTPSSTMASFDFAGGSALCSVGEPIHVTIYNGSIDMNTFHVTPPAPFDWGAVDEAFKSEGATPLSRAVVNYNCI